MVWNYLRALTPTACAAAGGLQQNETALLMDQVCKLVGGCSFVLNTGDNFYECGVQPNDYSRFQSDWIQVYQTPYTPTIRYLPWFNVFGAPALPLFSCGARMLQGLRAVQLCEGTSLLDTTNSEGADAMLRGCR